MARNRNKGSANGAATVQQNRKQNGNGRQGGKGGGGKGKGGGSAGQWLFVPVAAPASNKNKGAKKQVAQHMALFAKAGKGGGKGSKAKGKVMNWMSMQKTAQRAPAKHGKGKGGGRVNGNANNKSNGGGKAKTANAELDKLQPLDASVKVWVAGLDENIKWQKVKEHFKEIGQAKVALMPKGKACLAFATADEAQSAIATFNGSDLGGKTLEVDVWTQKERKAREPGSKRKKDGKKKALVKTGFAAKVAQKKKNGKDGKTDGKVTSKFWEKLKVLDDSLKVRVTNLADDVTPKQLKEHFQGLGAACKLVDIMVKIKGTACVGFETADEAESAVAAVGGSDLSGQLLEVAGWTRPERRERKKKDE